MVPPRIYVAEVRFEGSFLSSGHLPPFRGATLRGALGYHLRNTVCNSFQRPCRQCFLRFQCAYSTFFEGTPSEDRQIMRLCDKIPQPFMFVLNARDQTKITHGDRFIFGLRLFGSSMELFPYVAFALFEAGKKGIGQQGVRFEIDLITQDQTVLYEKSGTVIRKPEPQLLNIPPQERPNSKAVVHVLLCSPLRIRSEGRTALRFDFSDLIRAALRRITILNGFYGEKTLLDPEHRSRYLTLAENVSIVDDSLRPFGFDRYSGRQERSVRLDGVLGDISFRNVAPELLQILKITEAIGLGKSTSFGFGRINVTLHGESHVTRS